MRRVPGLVGIATVCTVSLIIFSVKREQKPYKLDIPDYPPVAVELLPAAKAAIGVEEDPEARSRYDWIRLKDPETNQVPAGIRQKELAFSRSLPDRQSNTVFRKSEEQVANWSNTGPVNFGGRTRALALDRRDNQRLLAGGVSGGMWLSENAGLSWQKVGDDSNLHNITSLVQGNGQFADHWYYGTGEITGNSARAPGAPFRGDGIYKSTDNGLTWQVLPSTTIETPQSFVSQFQYVHQLLVNRFSQLDELFAAVPGGIFRSVDGGATWQVVLGRFINPGSGTNLNDTDLSFYSSITQTSDGAFYAHLSDQGFDENAPDAGFYRSEDGVNWVNITPGLNIEVGRVVIDASESGPDELYFLLHAEDAVGLIKYIYRSGDGTGIGGRWLNLSENLPNFGGQVGDLNFQDAYNMVLRVHPTQPENVYVGGTNLFISKDAYSTDNFNYWIGGYDTANDVSIYPGHYVDQHVLIFDPENPSKAYSANDGGLYVTDDVLAEQMTWRPLNNGYLTTQFYTLAVDEFVVGGEVMGGLQDNATLLADEPIEGASWVRLLSGDGGYCAITQNAEYHYLSFQNSQIYRLTLNENNEITTFARIDPVGGGLREGQGYLFINPYIIDPNNQNRMYLAGGDVIWRNDNLAQVPLFKQVPTSVNWTTINSSVIAEGQISALAVGYNAEGVLYYGTSRGEMWRLDQSSSTMPERTAIPIVDLPEGAYISGIAVNRENAEEILVTVSNYNVISVFHSIDGGESYTAVAGNLEENPDGRGSGPSVRWPEVINLRNGDNLYMVGTSTGVYSTTELTGQNTVWQHENEIGRAVVNMLRYRPADATIWVASHGSGIYSAEIDGKNSIPISQRPEFYAFGQAFPNPFVASNPINVPFELPEDGVVRIKVYDLAGQHIKTILWSFMYAGESFASWDGTDENGVPVTPGTYLLSMEYEHSSQIKTSKVIFTQ
jgi:hypothetical protein